MRRRIQAKQQSTCSRFGSWTRTPERRVDRCGRLRGWRWSERGRLEAGRGDGLDFDREVVGYAAQPFWLFWRDGAMQRSHAPDFFARRRDGVGVVIDCRPTERIRPRRRPLPRICRTGPRCAPRTGGVVRPGDLCPSAFQARRPVQRPPWRYPERASHAQQTRDSSRAGDAAGHGAGDGNRVAMAGPESGMLRGGRVGELRCVARGGK